MATGTTRKWILLSVLGLSVVLTSATLGASTATVDWWVLGNGGGSRTFGSTSMDGTIGQWVVEGGTVGSTELGSGFWGGRTRIPRAALPLVLRSW